MSKRKIKKRLVYKQSIYEQLVYEFGELLPYQPKFDGTKINNLLNQIKPEDIPDLIKFKIHIDKDIEFRIKYQCFSDEDKEKINNFFKRIDNIIKSAQNKSIIPRLKEAINLAGLTSLENLVDFGFLNRVINSSFFSLKTLGILVTYCLAGQPVAGLVLSKRNVQTNTLNQMLSTNESDWFRFYDDIGIMIDEYLNYPLNIKEKPIFFKFLKMALSGDAIRSLNTESKEKLFKITDNELINRSNNLNDINDLETLYALFNVFLRVDYKGNSAIIYERIRHYADVVAAEAQTIVWDEQSESFAWHFTNLFWVLNVNFNKYVSYLANLDTFKPFLESLQRMNKEIYRWDKDSIFSFRTVLSINHLLRNTFIDNPEICYYLDQYTQTYVSETVNLAANQCFSLNAEEIKEATYIQYVRELPEVSKPLFSGLSKEVEKFQVFPYSYQYNPSGNAFKIQISSQKLLNTNDNDKAIIEEAINKTYERVEGLKAKLGISNIQSLTDTIFRLHIFKSNAEYVKYGPLWGVNTAGGGYAQVRSLSDDELPIDYGRQWTGDFWFETFVYRQEGDTRNRKNKEGGDFRNLGHEIQHTLFYALMGRLNLHNLPTWMIEGSANALGNEYCFKEEADYIKKFEDNLPTIERIMKMSYLSGGDLYYFGSALFRFLLEKYPDNLKKIIIAAQQEIGIDEINQLIKAWLKPLIETEFKNWLTTVITKCDKNDKTMPENSEISVQEEYLQDLKNNPDLLDFIQRHEPIEFIFHDTVFNLTYTNISRYNNNRDKTPQKISIADYNWFKSALEILVLDTQLTDLKITQKKDSIIESLVDAKKDQLSIRKILTINVNNVELSSELKQILKPIFEKFVLAKGFNLSKNLKKSFDRQGEVSSSALSRILNSKTHSESKCKRYIKNKSYSDEMLSDAPDQLIKVNREVEDAYQRLLSYNETLKEYIRNKGPIKFEFNDTLFVLSINKILRYDLNQNLQQLSVGDYEWFIGALEIYYVGNLLRQNSLIFNEKNIAEILNVSIEYVSNRRIKSINPIEDSCLHLQMQNFILSSDLNSILKNRLSRSGYNPNADKRYVVPPVINMTSVLGALSLLISNTSLILNPLVPKTYQLTQLNDAACKEDEDDANNLSWFILGGALSVAALTIAGFSFWYCNRKKANTRESASHNKADLIRHSLDGEPKIISVVQKTLQEIKQNLDCFEKTLKKHVSEEAYTSSFKENFLTAHQRLEELLNPSNENDKLDPKVFGVLSDSLRSIQGNLSDLFKKITGKQKKEINDLYKKINMIIPFLSKIRPLPQVNTSPNLAFQPESNEIKEEEECFRPLMGSFSNGVNNHAQNNNNFRNTQSPAMFGKMSSIPFWRTNSPPLAEQESQEMKESNYDTPRKIDCRNGCAIVHLRT